MSAKWTSCFGRDITPRKQTEEQLKKAYADLETANRRLQTLATQDGLTGLYNHRVFQEQLETEVRRALRFELPLALIMLDVDQFKLYNDTYGHPEGDVVLKQVARRLLEAARDTDLVARYGGEEFSLILPQTTADEALNLAERVRSSVASNPWDKRCVTVSLGVCALSSSAFDPASLASRADRALYDSKHAGRNRVTLGGG